MESKRSCRRCRRAGTTGVLLAALLVSALPAETPCVEEGLVRRAMHDEAFRLLALKIESVASGVPGGFDYHIDQAYEKIKERLPADPLSPTELEAWLGQYLQRPAAGQAENDLQLLIGNFIQGMSLEIINTLQFECEQAEDLLVRTERLRAWLLQAARRDRAALEKALRSEGLSRKTGDIIVDIERGWREPSALADDFAVYSALKKNMTGQRADRDQRLVFDLGDRYRHRHPFLGGFMAHYRLLADRFRGTALTVKELLEIE
jgi:hypothetical protein